MFFEEQIWHTKESLTRTEEELKGFQQRTGMFQVDARRGPSSRGSRVFGRASR